MAGAIALAIVLVVAVVGISMAMQGQRTAQTPPGQRPPRIPRPPATPRRGRERKAQPEASMPSPPPPDTPEPEIRGPELLRSGVASDAKVMSVVDERTTGPVTRSRLALEITPEDGPVFEVTVRVAFRTPEARAKVRVGGTVPVRYDNDDRTRVVVDVPQA